MTIDQLLHECAFAWRYRTDAEYVHVLHGETLAECIARDDPRVRIFALEGLREKCPCPDYDIEINSWVGCLGTHTTSGEACNHGAECDCRGLNKVPSRDLAVWIQAALSLGRALIFTPPGWDDCLDDCLLESWISIKGVEPFEALLASLREALLAQGWTLGEVHNGA